MKKWLVVSMMVIAVPVQAATHCDDAYQALKTFEAADRDQRIKDDDATIAAIQHGDTCSADNKARDERSNLFQQKLSELAKVFIDACRGDAAHKKDLDYYSQPGIINLGPSTLLKTCKILGK